jgi:hypothetical protein
MSALTVPFMLPKVEEVIPDYGMLKDRLTSSSIVEERYTASQVPSSGDSYGVGATGTKLMVIRLSNQNDYIDTSTMVLNFKVVGTSCDALAIDDHIFSLVDSINVKVGGQTVEVLNNVGHLVNTLVQGSMPLPYYKQAGGFEGLYIYDKMNDIQAPVTANTNGSFPDNGPNITGSALIDQRWAVGNSWLTSGRYYSVPLTVLGICRLNTLFCARNFQDLTLEFLWKNNVASATWGVNACSTLGATFTPQINISDVTLSYDCCRMSSDYYSLMDNELKMPNGSGVSYAIDTYQIQPANIASGSLTNVSTGSRGGLTRIVVAKGTRFLKSVYGVTKTTSSETDYRWRNNSSSGNFCFNSYQVVINSKRYPQLQIQSSALAFQELQKAYNQLGSVASGTIMSWYNYVGQPFQRFGAGGNTSNVAYGAVSTLVKQDALAVNTKDGTLLGAFPGDEAMFQVGVNLEQFLTSQPDAGGINTSSSGYQIAIELDVNGLDGTNSLTGNVIAGALTHYVILHFTRVLTLKGGAVEVMD